MENPACACAGGLGATLASRRRGLTEVAILVRRLPSTVQSAQVAKCALESPTVGGVSFAAAQFPAPPAAYRRLVLDRSTLGTCVYGLYSFAQHVHLQVLDNCPPR